MEKRKRARSVIGQEDLTKLTKAQLISEVINCAVDLQQLESERLQLETELQKFEKQPVKSFLANLGALEKTFGCITSLLVLITTFLGLLAILVEVPDEKGNNRPAIVIIFQNIFDGESETDSTSAVLPTHTSTDIETSAHTPQPEIGTCIGTGQLGPWEPENGQGPGVFIDARDRWVHANLWSPTFEIIPDYDEVSVIFEPGTQIMVESVAGTAWSFSSSCSREEIEADQQKHIVERREIGGKRVIAIDPIELIRLTSSKAVSLTCVGHIVVDGMYLYDQLNGNSGAAIVVIYDEQTPQVTFPSSGGACYPGDEFDQALENQWVEDACGITSGCPQVEAYIYRDGRFSEIVHTYFNPNN